jgi:hypothetical protein
MNILKAFFDTPQYISKTDTTADSPDPNPNDIWAFTDPDARDQYEQSGELDKLEHDIRFEVMRGETWLPEELEYKIEIRRLLREGTIGDKGSYWFTSPFPTVYRALSSGSFTAGGRDYNFREGDDIVAHGEVSALRRHGRGDEGNERDVGLKASHFMLGFHQTIH